MYTDSSAKLLRHSKRIAKWQAGENPAPVTIEWDLSNRCILGCQDCHFAHTHTRGPWVTKSREVLAESVGDLADETLVFRALREVKAAGVHGIVWSGGGEPTTHPRWREIVAHAAQTGLRQGMYTLGGLISEDDAALLSTALDWVVVSLDACTAKDYAKEKGVSESRFFAACDGISRLSKTKRTVVGASFLLHSDNWKKAWEMLWMSRNLGATYATFRPAIRTSIRRPAECTDNRDWIGEALAELRWISVHTDVELNVDRFLEYQNWSGRSYSKCYGIRLSTTITPDGRVWLCPQHRGVEGSCIGDLRTQSFEEIWANHPGHYADFEKCRVMCRLHLLNKSLPAVFEEQAHEAFL